jgi:hypothetical protein
MFAATVAALAVTAPSAQAGVLVKTTNDCNTGAAEQPFTQWSDGNDYVLAPGGAFEDGAPGWTLSGASVVDGNEPWQVHGDGGSSSLKIPAGRSATSSTMCVGLEDPTLRFFAKSTSTSLLGSLSTLAVEVQFETSVGAVVSVPIGVVLPGSKWQPTPQYLVLANLLPLLPGEHTPIRFKFTAIGGSTWQIDDVFVDPRSRV